MRNIFILLFLITCNVSLFAQEFNANVVVNAQLTGSITSSGLDYLRKNYVKVATGVTGSATASFAATTASAPSGMTATSESDFIFFMNGGYMEHNAIDVEQSGSIFLLKINTSDLGYNLESDDEIIAQGKFNS